MVKSFSLIYFLLIFSSILAFLSLTFSLWVYNYDYGAKLAAHSSSQANIGFTIEASNATCGDNLCNGAETCATCSNDCGICPVCGDNICNGAETCNSCSGDCGSCSSTTTTTTTTSGGSGGSGGGGAAYSIAPDFDLSEDIFNLKMVSGEVQTREIVIDNVGLLPLDLIITSTGISNHLTLSSNSISIKPGKRGSLNFTVKAPEPGIYAGKIILTFQGISKEVIVLLNVVSEGVLFDTIITVPDLYRILRVGQRLPVLIELLQIGQETGVDVTMNYLIKDFEENVYYTESETFYVNGAKSYNKRFSTDGLKPGDYIVGVELVYPGGFAASSAHFRISDSLITPQTWVAIGALIMAIIVCLLALLFFKRHNKSKKDEGKNE